MGERARVRVRARVTAKFSLFLANDVVSSSYQAELVTIIRRLGPTMCVLVCTGIRVRVCLRRVCVKPE